VSSRLSLWPHQAAYGLSRARKDLNIAELERLTVAWRVSLERDTGDGERRQRSVNASLRWATWEMVGQAQEHGWTISPLAFSAFVRAEMGRMRQQQRMASAVCSNASIRLTLTTAGPSLQSHLNVRDLLERMDWGVPEEGASSSVGGSWKRLLVSMRAFAEALVPVSPEAPRFHETIAWLMARQLDSQLPGTASRSIVRM
jgi:hypothetical protein